MRARGGEGGGGQGRACSQAPQPSSAPVALGLVVHREGGVPHHQRDQAGGEALLVPLGAWGHPRAGVALQGSGHPQAGVALLDLGHPQAWVALLDPRVGEHHLAHQAQARGHRHRHHHHLHHETLPWTTLHLGT